MISPLGPKSPRVDPSAFVAGNAVIVGDVAVGRESSIWFGAVVRGDVGAIRIGRRTNIQDLCVLHVDSDFDLTVGDEVTVGHRAILHGCRIGHRVLVGMGAIVLNGAEVAEECIIGAGAVVTEGAKIPPRSLVLGVPGRVVRGLDASELERIRAASDVYVRGAAFYATTELAQRTTG